MKQIGSPIEIYRNPANSFVANFIGSSNLIPCVLKGVNKVELFGSDLTLSKTDVVNIDIDAEGVFSIRPEDVVVDPIYKEGDLVGTVEFIRDLGANVEILVRLHELEILSVCTPKRRPNVEIGDKVGLKLHIGRAAVMAS